MELLPLIIVFVLFVVVAAIGVAVLFWLLRRAAESQAGDGQREAIEAAVAATLAERSATAEVLERDREATMHAAVDIAMSRVGEAADAKLDARLRVGTEALEKNLALGHQKYDDSTSMLEKRNAEIQLEMKRVEKMIHELQEKSAGQHGALVSQLEEAAKVTGQLQQTTGSLREALGNSKQRGNWGERMAEDVLRHAGMKEGINYRVQKGIESGGRPDYSFLMPHEKVLHMDVKFPADNYLAFLEAEGVDAALAETHRKQFCKDARARVKELAGRRYHEEADSVDAVVLLIPNESIFAFVQENDAELMDVAMASKIVMCGPSTLLAVLQVIRQSIDNFMLEKRSTEILECLNGFKIEFGKYTEQLEKHGKHMLTAMKSFEALSGTRTNVLQRNLDKIEQLQSASEQRSLETTVTEPSAEPEVDSDDSGEWPQLREVASA